MNQDIACRHGYHVCKTCGDVKVRAAVQFLDWYCEIKFGAKRELDDADMARVVKYILTDKWEPDDAA